MTVGGSIVSGLIWGIPMLGMPACVVVFGLVVVGRRLAGKTGTWIGAAIAVLLVSLPLLWSLSHYAVVIARGEPLIPQGPNQFRGFFILGEGLTAVLFAFATLYFMWSNQAHQARLPSAGD